MDAHREYRYVIDAFTSDTLPMARLAEYMREVAALLGEPERVHFARLEAGSAVLVSKIEARVGPKVAARVNGLKDGTAPR
jgi:predicted ATPase